MVVHKHFVITHSVSKFHKSRCTFCKSNKKTQLCNHSQCFQIPPEEETPSAMQHNEVEDTEQQDKSFWNGKARFTFKAHSQIPGAGYYQADCPLNGCKHKEVDEDGNRSSTRCRRRLSFSDAHEEPLVLRRLQWWCCIAKDFKSKSKHQQHCFDDDDIQDELLADILAR